MAHHPLRDRVTSVYGRFWGSETAVMLIMALLVGGGSGLGAVAFRQLIELSHTLFFEMPATLSRDLSLPTLVASAFTVLAPGLGGLLVGLLAHRVAPEVRGPGVSSVIESLALRRGRIRSLIIAAKPIATSLTIGSGGSAGRAGPVVQLGAAVGSAVSRLARLSDERTKSLVACGAAGGIAATFNAPLAGVMFAVEVLLAEFGLVQFTGVVVAAVIASVIGHAFIGDVAAFPFPPSAPFEARELPVYALLGIAAAFVGVGFTRALYAIDDFVSERSWPPALKPALGGLGVGIIGLGFPRVLGIGYDSIEAVLFNRLAIQSILALGLLKVVVTALTIGSGGSGGIFAPCLFVGAMLGGLFGHVAQRAMPGGPAPAAYALVGMSAVFAAASQAPITAVLTLFEMTRDYTIILPLMLATVISAFVARRFLEGSIYTLDLRRRGIDVEAGRNLDLMSAILVREAMTPIAEVPTVKPTTPLTELTRMFDKTHHHGFVVVDDERHLEGVVCISDLERAQTRQLVSGTVQDIQTSSVRTVFADQSLKTALQRFGVLDVGRIPVVDRADPGRVIGLLRRGDILRAYSHAAVDEQARIARLSQARLKDRAASPAGGSSTRPPIIEIRLEEDHEAVGKTLQELDLPSGSLIASIRRDEQVLIPRGDTRLRAGDTVVALVASHEEELVRSRLTETTEPR